MNFNFQHFNLLLHALHRRRDPRSAGPAAGPRDPRAGMSRPGGGPPIPPLVPAQGGGPPPSVGAINPGSLSLGPGTTDQEKVSNKLHLKT